MNRYHRQTLLPQIGDAGQARLSNARVLLIGCGALGTVLADQLVRAGVGSLRISDRDIVELTNLQRQVLFDETDAAEGTPKAVAAGRRLAKINSSVKVDSLVADVHAGNIEELAGLDDNAKLGSRIDLILDGTDNVETRFLINDVSVKHGVPWVYGACVGTEGRVMAVPPGGPCLRCMFVEAPAIGELATCDTVGVLGPAAAMVASMQATLAIQILSGQVPARQLLSMDVWAGRFRTIATDGPRMDCPCCVHRQFEFLNRSVERSAVSLCGRNAVQIRLPQLAGDLSEIAARLLAVGQVESTPFLVRCKLKTEPGINLTIFSDGRTIVHGTTDLALARSLVSRYVSP